MNRRHTGNARNRHSFSGKSSAEENNFTTTSSKPFGMSELIVFVTLNFPIVTKKKRKVNSSEIEGNFLL